MQVIPGTRSCKLSGVSADWLDFHKFMLIGEQLINLHGDCSPDL